MEPTNNSASNLESQEVFDNDHLEKIVRDFHEFQGRMPGAIKLEDLIDMYINIGGVNLPEDVNEIESSRLPHQVHSALQSTYGFNTGTAIQDSEIMNNEMTEGTSQNDTGNFPDSCPTLNTISYVGAGGSNSRVKYIRYGDLNCPGVADGIIRGVIGCTAETVFHSVMKHFRTPGAVRKNLQQQKGVTKNGDGSTSRNSIKRKHNQIIETEEETGH